jgi:hypothetical protein
LPFDKYIGGKITFLWPRYALYPVKKYMYPTHVNKYCQENEKFSLMAQRFSLYLLYALSIVNIFEEKVLLVCERKKLYYRDI